MSDVSPTCAACAGVGKTVYDGGRCSVCRGTGMAPMAPEPGPPRKLQRLYEAQAEQQR